MIKIFSKIFLFIISIFLMPPLQAGQAPNIWDVLRNQFSINHAANTPEVQAQIRWIIAHPGYLQSLARSEPYMYHIVTAIKQRQMPGELALLPLIESAFNPFAHSVVGAAGIWQLMPGTGQGLGLTKDFWFDGRRSIGSSTEAALNYLHYLHRFFNGDWHLAIAAYDCGEGCISRAMQNSEGRKSFWDLNLPNETKVYVPRLLALAELIEYPENYRIKLPEIAHTPYFKEVEIGSQIDLNHAAKLAGISYHELIKLNPGYNRWATAPNQPFKLLIPADKVDIFNYNLAQLPKEKRVSLIKHRVGSGENLNSIAQHYLTSPKLIRELNQIKNNMEPALHQIILIPSTKNALAGVSKTMQSLRKALKEPAQIQTYKVIHIVQANDSIESLEKKYLISADALRQWNKMDAGKALRVGEELLIWRKK